MKIMISAFVLASSSAAYASDDASFARLNLEVAQRCGSDSNLQSADISRIVLFDDSLGKVVALVTGRERVRTRAGTRLVAVKKLCVYDKRTKRTWLDEAVGWSAPDLK